MTYGRWTQELADAARPFIVERTVWALGCGGDFHEAILLQSLQAKHVVLVDKLFRKGRGPHVDKGHSVTVVGAYFDEVSSLDLGNAPDKEVAFVKWPVSTTWGPDTLPPFLSGFKYIVYVGINDGYTACGTPDLWRFLFDLEKVFELKTGADDMMIWRNPDIPVHH